MPEQLQCPNCGRFAKPGRPPEMDMFGEYPYSVYCSVHGEVWTA